jgi:methylenetetrahydrofolate reductase (NADPH)
MFFDVDLYLKFVDDCQAFGIHIPIIPGLMIIQAYPGFRKMVGFCKTRVPAELEAKMESLKDDPDGVKAFGIEFTTGICRRLMAAGKSKCKGLHFYTLNLEKSTMGILDALGMSKPVPEELK